MFVLSSRLDSKFNSFTFFDRRQELFGRWSDTQLGDLCFLSPLVSLPAAKVIEIDWSQAQHVYFVVEVSQGWRRAVLWGQSTSSSR